MGRLQKGVGRLMKDEDWLVDEVLGGSGRCVSPKGGGGLGGQGGVDGGWGSRGSPQGGLGGEKAVCLADKIHGRAPGSSMHHPLHPMKLDGFVEKMPSETDVAPKAIINAKIIKNHSNEHQ